MMIMMMLKMKMEVRSPTRDGRRSTGVNDTVKVNVIVSYRKKKMAKLDKSLGLTKLRRKRKTETKQNKKTKKVTLLHFQRQKP